jgi:hypothetical protein
MIKTNNKKFNKEELENQHQLQHQHQFQFQYDHFRKIMFNNETAKKYFGLHNTTSEVRKNIFKLNKEKNS